MCEAFAKLPGFAVAHENRVTEFKRYLAVVADRRLNLTGTFKRVEPGTPRQVWQREFFGAYRAGSDIAAAEAGINGWMRVTHDLDGEARGGLITEVAVVVEEGRGVEARPDRDLGDGQTGGIR